MKNRHPTRNNLLDLSLTDVQIIRARIDSSTAFWGLRTTRGPNPSSRLNGPRWAYLFWEGPPSHDIVPGLAVLRCVDTYRITILDPLELFSSGKFETIERSDLMSAVDLIEELLLEARECAMYGSPPSRISTSNRARADLH
jgi:hypothetical protein